MSGRPVWDDLVGTDDRAALDPGTGAFDPAPDVLVVGGGVAGLATAMFLRRSGARVLVCERGRLAAASSGRAAGGLAPTTHLGEPPPWWRLAHASLALHRELDGELGYGLRRMDWVVPSGPVTGDARAALGRSGVDVVEGPAVRDIEPALAACDSALVFRDQAHVDPLRFAAALAREAGSVVTGVEVVGAERDGDRIAAVRTTRGDIAPGTVLYATGVAPLEAGVGARSTLKGHLVATEPAPFRLRAGVGSSILAVQLADGRIVAGGTLDAGDAEDVVRADVVDAVRAELGRLLPAAAALAVTHEWCCFRPSTVDGLPIVDRVPGAGNAWYLCGLLRTGLLLAPAIGRSLATWIVSGRRPEDIASLGIDRGRY